MKEILIPNIDEKIYLSNNTLYNIVIENPHYLRTFVQKILNQIETGEEYLLCFDKLKEIDISKQMYLNTNPFTFEIDEKKASLAIQKDMVSKITHEQNEKYLILINEINDFISEIILDYPIALEYNSEISLSNLFKTISLTYVNNCESFLESMLLKIKVLYSIFHISIFIFLNIHDYLDTSEIDLLYREMIKLELTMILISSNAPKEKITEEYLVIIDKDLCEIHVDKQK